MAATSLKHDLKVVIDRDRMRASVSLSPRAECSQISEEEVIGAIQTSGIILTPQVRERVGAFLAAVQSGVRRAERFLVAEGTQPSPPRNAQFVMADVPPCDTPTSSAEKSDGPKSSYLNSIDFFELTHIRTAIAGEVLGCFTPAEPGKPGTDVLGRPAPPRGMPTDIALGENVALASDGRTVQATVDGMVHWTGRRLAVLGVVEIAGDVDFASGSVEAPTDVLVRGDIKDAFHVRSSRHIAVKGVIGACKVTAGGNIQVSGGIAGKEKAQIEAQGQVVAKFCDSCSVRATGDLVIAAEAINSRLYTLGLLRMARGSLIGGYAYARCGGQVKILGSDAGIKTTIAIGMDPNVLGKCAEIDDEIVRRRRAAAKIRETVGPLLGQLQHLLPAQRAKVTELLYEAERVEVVVPGLLARKEDLIKRATPDESPALLVSTRIWPGVSVIIGDLMSTFVDEQKGPVKIMRRATDHGDELVCVSENTGHVVVLPSRSSLHRTNG